jgi:hypothetical protein
MKGDFYSERMEFLQRINAALELAMNYGTIDGDHHKAWVIDQMVRRLASGRYEEFVQSNFPDGSWTVGTAP